MVDDDDYIPFEGRLWPNGPPPISEKTWKVIHEIFADRADENRCAPPIHILTYPEDYT